MAFFEPRTVSEMPTEDSACLESPLISELSPEWGSFPDLIQTKALFLFVESK